MLVVFPENGQQADSVEHNQVVGSEQYTGGLEKVTKDYMDCLLKRIVREGGRAEWG